MIITTLRSRWVKFKQNEMSNAQRKSKQSTECTASTNTTNETVKLPSRSKSTSAPTWPDRCFWFASVVVFTRGMYRNNHNHHREISSIPRPKSSRSTIEGTWDVNTFTTSTHAKSTWPTSVQKIATSSMTWTRFMLPIYPIGGCSWTYWGGGAQRYVRKVRVYQVGHELASSFINQVTAGNLPTSLRSPTTEGLWRRGGNTYQRCLQDQLPMEAAQISTTEIGFRHQRPLGVWIPHSPRHITITETR